MKTKSFLSVISLVFVLTACNPGRHEMPITTTSEEARELFIKGRDLLENGETISGDSLLHQAIEMDSNFALAYLYLHLRAGIDKAMSFAPIVSPGERLMIRASDASYTQNLTLARALTDSLLDLYPRDKYCLYFASGVYFRVDADKSIELLYKAIKQDPYYMAAFNILGYRLMALDRYKEAKEAFERYLDFWPKSANTQHSYAEMLVQTGEEKEALKQFERVLQLDPNYTGAHVNVAWMHIRFGDYEKARAYCEEFYERVPTENEKERAICMLANVHFIQGDLSAALETMDRQIRRLGEENNAAGAILAMHEKGWYALRGGLHQLAIETFTNGLNLLLCSSPDIDNYRASALWLHGGLSITYGEIDEKEKSEFHLDQARSVYNAMDRQSYWKGMMITYEAANAIKNGNYDWAISELQIPARAVSVSSQYYLAKAYEIIGNKEEAIKYYTKVIKQFDPYMTGFFYAESKGKLEELGELSPQ